jgi:hypothetical protein
MDMTTSYPEQLGEWVKRRMSRKPASSVARFLAVRDDVKAAIDAGYPVKTIWTQMYESKCVNVSYDTFIRYVNRYINNRGNSTSATDLVKSSAPVQKASSGTPSRPEVSRPGPVAGFTFNSDPKKEDLI